MDRSGAVIIPPIIGAASRCMTSEPVPVLISSGNNPARMTATVIAFGLTRRAAPTTSAYNEHFRRDTPDGTQA